MAQKHALTISRASLTSRSRGSQKIFKNKGIRIAGYPFFVYLLAIFEFFVYLLTEAQF